MDNVHYAYVLLPGLTTPESHVVSYSAVWQSTFTRSHITSVPIIVLFASVGASHLTTILYTPYPIGLCLQVVLQDPSWVVLSLCVVTFSGQFWLEKKRWCRKTSLCRKARPKRKGSYQFGMMGLSLQARKKELGRRSNLRIPASLNWCRISQSMIGGVLYSDIDDRGRVSVWSVDRRCVFFGPVMHIYI